MARERWQQVSGPFHFGLECQLAQRAASLNQAYVRRVQVAIRRVPWFAFKTTIGH
jgi:hypothetical protein